MIIAAKKLYSNSLLPVLQLVFRFFWLFLIFYFWLIGLNQNLNKVNI